MAADRVIRWTTAGAVAGVAAMTSYEHAHALVRAHGEAGRTGRPVPLTMDRLIYVTSIVMLDSARRKVPVRAPARWLLGLGDRRNACGQRGARPGRWPWRVPQWPHGRRSHWSAPMSCLPVTMGRFVRSGGRTVVSHRPGPMPPPQAGSRGRTGRPPGRPCSRWPFSIDDGVAGRTYRGQVRDFEDEEGQLHHIAEGGASLRQAAAQVLEHLTRLRPGVPNRRLVAAGQIILEIRKWGLAKGAQFLAEPKDHGARSGKVTGTWMHAVTCRPRRHRLYRASVAASRQAPRRDACG